MTETATANKILIERLVNGLNGRASSIFEEVYAQDYVGHDPDRADTRRFEDLPSLMTGLLGRTFPDGHYTTESLTGDADKVVWQWEFRGTHRGPLLGMPATGRRITIRGVNVFRVADGKVVEDWIYRDTAGILRQIGVLPPLAARRR
ncbi:MAG TPA: ester cyclase [Candidatus Thermoplasmatota archaeon]|jgi:steroid delta-isomerase-like uncharacterized protein|nr:ester cyclase [Candidatus Thermoplasmatota archaeon]